MIRQIKPVWPRRANIFHRLMRDCELFLPFNEGTGTRVGDVLRNRHYGDVSGASWVAGRANIGFALSFDGNDYIAVSDKTYLRPGSNDFTAGIWVNFPIAGDGWAGIFCKGMTTLAPKNTWGLTQYSDTTDQILFAISADAGLSFAAFLYTDALADGWHFVVCRREGATANLYVDGESVAEDTSAAADLSSDADMQIGRDAASVYITAVLDAPFFYRRSLATAEILELYRDTFAAMR